MNHQPLVSVIIPVFNGQKYLRECLQSVLNQTYKELEILVVDDGSSDGSVSIIKAFRDPRIKLLSHPNAGRCVARNNALRIATGRFVKYLDQDDLLDSESVRVQVEDLQNADEDVISFGVLKTFTSDLTSVKELDFFHRFQRECDPVDFYCRLGADAVQTSVWLTPRSLHLKGGEWNEELVENPMDDGELFMRILMKAKAVKFCEQSVSYHRESHANRGSNHDNPTKIRSYFRALALCTDELLARETSTRTKAVCAGWLKHSLYLHFDFDAKLTAGTFSRIAALGNPQIDYYVGGNLFRALDRHFGLRFALVARYYAKRL